MNELQDIRGQEFVLRYVSGYPLDCEILLKDRQVGRVYKPTNLKPVVRAAFADVDWELTAKTHLLGVTHTLRFVDSGIVIAESSLVRATVDGSACYKLVRSGFTGADWQSNKRSVAWFSGDYKETRARTERDLDPLHAVVLVILGFTMLANTTLYADSG